ncbi:MAG: response regulator [Oscillatoria princeps RMCB-10]|jgi:DNA-binding response OmpR family regulator|nr:response regulator [Oscillatoria princeps RMCB-10]
MADRHRKILIIDDSPEDRATYRRYLLQDSKYTYTVVEEDSGKRGLELCDQPDLDVVLLDLRLPDLDGFEFLSELRAQPDKNTPPVVMLTGQGNESVAVAAMKSGATDYPVKGKTSPENFRHARHSAIENSHRVCQRRSLPEQPNNSKGTDWQAPAGTAAGCPANRAF